MDVQHRKQASNSTHTSLFVLSASFNQYLCYWIIFAVVMTSFIAWPQMDSILFKSFFYILILLVPVVFAWQLLVLRKWQCQIIIDGALGGRLVNGQSFTFGKAAFICPLFCLLYLEFEDESRQICCVWADMLDDSQYRTLCRLVNQSRPV
ncbi:protein YgfX [Shewanella glacialimarina]|uniref:protein YgfX n=1 Tax=Shewanella glacialimarina TaxID=2590884 RepID=UPI00299EE2F8|nr:protein YgfX [Shewanella glacialimarina]